VRRLRDTFLALLIGCCAPVLVWVGAGSALYHRQKRAKERWAEMVCRIDADCPSGYLCVNGRCVPEPEKAL